MNRKAETVNPIAGGNNFSKTKFSDIEAIVENTQGLVNNDLLLEVS